MYNNLQVEKVMQMALVTVWVNEQQNKTNTKTLLQFS